MNKTYLFSINNHRVIINEEYSGIGYCYPRIFVEKDKDTHYNIDTTIGHIFDQKLSEFESWIDGTEQAKDLSDFDGICNNLGLNPDALMSLIEEMIA